MLGNCLSSALGSRGDLYCLKKLSKTLQLLLLFQMYLKLILFFFLGLKTKTVNLPIYQKRLKKFIVPKWSHVCKSLRIWNVAFVSAVKKSRQTFFTWFWNDCVAWIKENLTVHWNWEEVVLAPLYGKVITDFIFFSDLSVVRNMTFVNAGDSDSLSTFPICASRLFCPGAAFRVYSRVSRKVTMQKYIDEEIMLVKELTSWQIDSPQTF